MIISFKVENFLSFRNEVEFSLIPGRELQHREHLAQIGKYKLRILPIAAIYGANASGKSNFCDAIGFAQKYIVEGRPVDAPIPTKPFKLDPKNYGKPSKFVFELVVEDEPYEFGFVVDRKHVIEEWLTKILKTSERKLYHRKKDNIEFGTSAFDDKQKFLQFTFKGTRPNQLFLTNSVDQNLKSFKPIHDWFQQQLIIISPEAQFIQTEKMLPGDDTYHEYMSKALHKYDTGVLRLDSEKIPIDSIQLPRELSDLIMNIGKDERVSLESQDGERFICSRIGKEIKISKLISYHSDVNGKDVKFALSEESDGTMRMIDLLPAFHIASRKVRHRVFIIDEFDRSLHSLITRELIKDYLGICGPDTRSQLIFTTHDIMLMDQEFLRRDEMWIVDRSKNGESELYSISDYKEIRNDKDIQKSYMQGRFGGIPKILFSEAIK